MVEESKLISLEIEMKNINHRIDRLENDHAKVAMQMTSSLKGIQDQVTLYNQSINRFWDVEWPSIKKAIMVTDEKLASVIEEAVQERIKSAVAVERTANENALRAKETESLKTDLDNQRSIVFKLLLAAIAGGGSIQLVVQLLHNLLGAG